MRLFYAEQIEMPNFTFDESESKHIAKVLRLKVGGKLMLTDGKGFFYESEISEVSKKTCSVKILRKEQQVKHNYYLHVAISPTKNNDRFEWFLEKATEIGIDEITPLLTKNSERTKIKIERFQKVIESAMKQSHKAYHPILNNLTTFGDFVNQDLNYDKKMMAHCYDANKFSLKKSVEEKQRILIMIGPEGDFTLEEVELATKKGISPLSLGTYRLRTETAGIASVQSVAFINQE